MSTNIFINPNPAAAVEAHPAVSIGIHADPNPPAAAVEAQSNVTINVPSKVNPVPSLSSNADSSFHVHSTRRSDRPPYLMCEVHATCNGHEMTEEFLVDTGASGIYLHLDRARLLYGEDFPSDTTEVTTSIVANEVEVETFRGPLTKFSILGRTLTTRPFVMQSLSYQGILGMDALRSLKFDIDIGNHRLIPFGDGTPDCVPADLGHPFSAVESDDLGVIAADKAVTIPPMSACLVPGLLLGDSSINEFCLLEPSSKGALSKGLMVPASLAAMQGSRVPVLVTNTTERELLIHRKTRIANAVQIDHRHRPTLSAMSVAPAPPPRLTKQEFLSKFNIPDSLSQRESETLKSFLWKERHVFSQHDFDIGCFEGIKHAIDTGNERPHKENLRRHNPKTREDLKHLVQEMLSHGIIRPSFSPWSSAPVLVQKKSGGKRFAVDYRGLNAKTVSDSYPLPQIADALDCFAGSNFYSCLDLTQGFWQIELEEESKPKTAFSTPQGHYEFNRCAFGLKTAPSSFQRAMACCLEGLNWEIALCFLDDIIVFSRTFDEHLSRLRQVFDRLNLFKVKLKPKKCQFMKSEVAYLGHRVSAEGISADPKKIEAIKEWKRPTTATQVRSFLGLAQYYRRFVKNFSSVASPLYDCIRHGERKISWESDQESAFQEIKNRLSSPPVMAHPNFDLPFVVDTDASCVGIGCVLSQIVDGKERVIAYASHKFNKAERKWHTTDREFFALVMACRLFKSYLYGRRFTMRTDHQALLGLQRKAKEFTGKMARWWTELSLYDYSLQYRPGVSHGNADGLSRQPHFDDEDDIDVPGEANALRNTPAEPIDIVSLQRGDPVLSFIRNHVLAFPGQPLATPPSKDDDDTIKHFKRNYKSYSIKDNILKMSGLSVMPRAGLPSLFYILHDSPISGHLGKSRTFKSLKERFWWPGQWKDIDSYIRSCISCQARKSDAGKTYAPLKASEPTDHPWQRLAMDIVTLPSCRGYDKVLVVVDYFSKWVEAFPLRDKSASTVANILLNEIILRWGPPTYLHSDRGTEFTSKVVHELTRLSSIYQTHTPAYSPKADGLVERQIRTLVDMLAKYAHEKGDWLDYLHPCLCAVRCTVQETIGFSPFEVIFGRQPRLIADLCYGLPARSRQRHPDTYRELQARLRDVHADVTNNQRRVADRMKQLYDSKRKTGLGIFQEGEWVWVQAQGGHRPKLFPKFDGPFLVHKINEAGSLYVARSGRIVKTPQDHCKLFTRRPSHLQSKDYQDAFAKARVDYSQSPPELRVGHQSDIVRGDTRSNLPSSVAPSYFPRSGVFLSDSRPTPPEPPRPAPLEPPRPISPVPEQTVDASLPVASPPMDVNNAPSPSHGRPPLGLDQPVVLLERLSDETIAQFAQKPPHNLGDSAPPPPELSGGEGSPVVSSSPPPAEAVPSSSRPSRSHKPRKVLTYDENFRQLSTLHKNENRDILYKNHSTHRIFSDNPFLELGIVVVDFYAGLIVTKLFPGLLADYHGICKPGDIVKKINGVPVTDTLEFINSLPHLGPIFTIEFAHR